MRTLLPLLAFAAPVMLAAVAVLATVGWWYCHKPKPSLIKPGMTREEVRRRLGDPISSHYEILPGPRGPDGKQQEIRGAEEWRYGGPMYGMDGTLTVYFDRGSDTVSRVEYRER